MINQDELVKERIAIRLSTEQRIAKKKLIDYFAGAAMAYLVNVSEPGNLPVHQAFNIAEAMYAESEKRYGPD